MDESVAIKERRWQEIKGGKKAEVKKGRNESVM
jgi:hypothetical protein